MAQITVPNKAILNTMTSMMFACEAIIQLSRGAWEHYKSRIELHNTSRGAIATTIINTKVRAT